MPFPLAETNAELEEKIKNFDAENYANQINELIRETEYFEDGKASIRVYNMLTKILAEKEANEGRKRKV